MYYRVGTTGYLIMKKIEFIASFPDILPLGHRWTDQERKNKDRYTTIRAGSNSQFDSNGWDETF